MNVSVQEHSSGFPVHTVRSGENEFEISAFGAQVLSWTKAGVEILFANRDRAVLDGRSPYRGGAPICFPYFSKGSLLPSVEPLSPQHGAARTSVWNSEPIDGGLIFRTQQAAPPGFGATLLNCELVYVFEEDLRIEATVTNIGAFETRFQLAVHSYWAFEDPARVTVMGLGSRFFDNLSSMAEAKAPFPAGPHEPPFDRVYPDAEEDLELVAERYRLHISTVGCAGAVLWNPGPHHSIGDLGSPDFVCVESGVIVPAKPLGVGEEYCMSIDYRVEV